MILLFVYEQNTMATVGLVLLGIVKCYGMVNTAEYSIYFDENKHVGKQNRVTVIDWAQKLQTTTESSMITNVKNSVSKSVHEYTIGDISHLRLDGKINNTKKSFEIVTDYAKT